MVFTLPIEISEWIENNLFFQQSHYFYKIPMENKQWQKDKMEARIINGHPVKFSIPWMVKLDIKKGGRSGQCTGFIVTAWHIMV